jgi:hypothetical protein
VLVAGALATGAALTMPFTWPADVVTALAFALVVAGYAARLAAAPRTAVAPGAIPTESSGSIRTMPPARRGAWLPWAAVVAAVVAWELATYFVSPRVAHPTLSSIADILTGHPVTRGVAFVAYLAFGWYLTRR